MERMMYIKKTEPSDYRIEATNKDIKEIVERELKSQGESANLNNINVEDVTDMSDLFYGKLFNGDVSEWDVSKVKNMNRMFYGSKFNGDISHWNVCSVIYHSEFCDDSPLANHLDKQPKFSK